MDFSNFEIQINLKGKFVPVPETLFYILLTFERTCTGPVPLPVHRGRTFEVPSLMDHS